MLYLKAMGGILLFFHVYINYEHNFEELTTFVHEYCLQTLFNEQLMKQNVQNLNCFELPLLDS